MTRQEFENRTGLQVTESEYFDINTQYMNTDLDKDTFCDLYTKCPTALEELINQTLALRELKADFFLIGNFLIDEAHEQSSQKARNKAIAILGKKEYIKSKIKKGYQLSPSDKDLLMEIL